MSNSIFRHSHRTAGKALDIALESVHEAAMFHALSGYDPAWLVTLLTYIDNARELGAPERGIVDAMDAGCHAAADALEDTLMNDACAVGPDEGGR